MKRLVEMKRLVAILALSAFACVSTGPARPPAKPHRPRASLAEPSNATAINFNPQQGAITATPGALAVQNILGTLKQVNDQGVATAIGGGGGGGVSSVTGTAPISVATGTTTPVISLATQADQTLFGNTSGGTAIPGALTVTQAQSMLAVPTPVTTAAQALARARTLLGNTMNCVLGTDFETDQFVVTVAVGSAGTTSMLQNQLGGVLKLSTTGTSAHGIVIAPHGSPSYVANGRTSKWYAVERMQFNTAATAQTAMAMELINPASLAAYQNIRWGINSTATNLSWQSVDNSNVSLASGTTAIAYDTSFHTFEAWNDLSNLDFGYDLGSSVTPTVSTPSTNIYPGAFTLGALAYNGTDSVTRDLWIDSMWFVTTCN